jgi:hypothetical protein
MLHFMIPVYVLLLKKTSNAGVRWGGEKGGQGKERELFFFYLF